MKRKHYALLMVALLNLIVFSLFYLFFPVILRASQNIPFLGKFFILLVGLLAWPLVSLIASSKTRPSNFIPFKLIFESSFEYGWASSHDYSLDRLGFVGIQVVSVCAIVTMLANFLGSAAAIVFFCISVGGTVCLSFAAVFLLREIEKLLYLDSGNAIDHSHSAVWRYGRERTVGVATKKEVYEHYHGQFSWYERYSRLLAVLRLAAFAFSTGLPLVLLMSNKEWGISSPSNTTSWFALAAAAMISFLIYYVIPSFRRLQVR